MSIVKNALTSLQTSLKTITSNKVYTGRLDNISNAKDTHLGLDDSNTWVINDNSRLFNVLIQFRFQLDGIDPGTPYFEDDAQDEVYDWIIQLISFPIAGVTLVHNKTSFAYDEQERYIGAVLFNATFSEVSLCL